MLLWYKNWNYQILTLKKFFGPQKFFDPEKLFGPQNFFWPTIIFLTLKFFDP